MHFSQLPNPFSSLRRWQPRLLVAVILGVQYWQTRGLPEGVAPLLEDVRTDGSPARVGAGDTANSAPTLMASLAMWRPLCPAEIFQA